MKYFDHKSPVRDKAGEVVGFKESPARAVTRGVLGHGPDKGRRVVVSLVHGDLLEFRPQGTRRRYRIGAMAAYEWVLRSLATAANLQRLRERKANKAKRLAEARQRRAERRLCSS
jgi:hypothetical protein